MNFSMWRKALRVIPRMEKEEWDRLDFISKWLISTRSAVLVMTFISSSIAGIFAIQSQKFNLGLWILLSLGLILAHATNNLFNDLTDHLKGVDRENYFRAQYGIQPLEHGFLSIRQHLAYTIFTGFLALISGIVLIYLRGGLTLPLLLAGSFFVLFYTFPLKYIALGEISVLLVWGPLMVGGGYYVITGDWSWNVVIASLPYAIGVTTVIFGKHIDKFKYDRERKIYTLPVLIGEKASRYTVIFMTIFQYLFVLYLVIKGFFTPFPLIVLIVLKTFFKYLIPMYRNPKPEAKPDDYPEEVWPLWYVAGAFYHNRRFGVTYLLGLLADTIYKLIF